MHFLKNFDALISKLAIFTFSFASSRMKFTLDKNRNMVPLKIFVVLKSAPQKFLESALSKLKI